MFTESQVLSALEKPTFTGLGVGVSSSTSFVSRLSTNFINLASRGLNPYLIATACISETAQEIFLDPWIEATMSNLVADIGWGVFWQAFFSGLVEGGRETFMGPIAQSTKSSLFNVKNELRANQMLDQNQHVMVEQDLQQQEVSYARQFATTSMVLFGTLLVSGFLGSLIGPSIAAGLIAIVVMFQGDGDGDNKNELARAKLAQLAEMIRVERTPEYLLGNIYGGYDFDPLWNRISDDQWNVFTEGQEIVKESHSKFSLATIGAGVVFMLAGAISFFFSPSIGATLFGTGIISFASQFGMVLPNFNRIIKDHPKKTLIKDFAKDFLSEGTQSQRVKFLEIIISELNKYPDNIQDIISIKKMAIKVGVSHSTIARWIRKYLYFIYSETASEIYSEIWSTSNPQVYLQKYDFIQIIESEISKNYPNNIKDIDSLSNLAIKIGVTRITIVNWLKKYLKQKYGSIIGLNMFNDIWSSRQWRGGPPSWRGEKISYERIELAVKSRGGTLLTSEKQFNKMKGRTGYRTVRIECDKGHEFYIRVEHLLYHGEWCSICTQKKMERFMRLFMEEIFGVPFESTTFYKAYGLSLKEGGRLKWDGYNAEVIIEGKKFRIAFEYDGIQHDIYPNYWHRTRKEFLRQQENDEKKNTIAMEDDKKTIVIRLKEKEGFTLKTWMLFEREILKQFYLATGIRLTYRGYQYDIETHSLIPSKGLIDKFLGTR